MKSWFSSHFSPLPEPQKFRFKKLLENLISAFLARQRRTRSLYLSLLLLKERKALEMLARCLIYESSPLRIYSETPFYGDPRRELCHHNLWPFKQQQQRETSQDYYRLNGEQQKQKTTMTSQFSKFDRTHFRC